MMCRLLITGCWAHNLEIFRPPNCLGGTVEDWEGVILTISLRIELCSDNLHNREVLMIFDDKENITNLKFNLLKPDSGENSTATKGCWCGIANLHLRPFLNYDIYWNRQCIVRPWHRTILLSLHKDFHFLLGSSTGTQHKHIQHNIPTGLRSRKLRRLVPWHGARRWSGGWAETRWSHKRIWLNTIKYVRMNMWYMQSLKHSQIQINR